MSVEVSQQGPDQVYLEAYGEQVYARRWLILGILCLSLVIVSIGNTSLNVAIPTLARELNASTSDLQWMVDAYALVFAGMLFTAGTIGDRYGRKGVLQAGLTLFLIAAAVASTAETSLTIIGARAAMGLAGSFVMPSTLSILTNVFPAAERPKAIATWAGLAGGGAAIGPIASGFILEHFRWHWIFLINVPVILLAIVAGALWVPRSRDPQEHPLDLIGAVLSIFTLVTLVYAIIEAPARGWLSSNTLGLFAAAGVGLGMFIFREHHTDNPMIDLRFFNDRRFSVASAGMALTFFAMYGTFFLVAQYFQLVLGYSALQSGLFQLPMALIMMLVAPRVPTLVNRFGVSRVVPAGLATVSLGLFIFSRCTADISIVWVYPALFPLAVGMSCTMAPLTTLIMTAIPPNKAGVGSAMNDTTRELGGALGVAVLGSIVTTRYTTGVSSAFSALPEKAQSAANSGLAGALQVAKAVGGEAGERLAHTAKLAFVDGMSLAAVCGAVAVLIAALVTRKVLPRD